MILESWPPSEAAVEVDAVEAGRAKAKALAQGVDVRRVAGSLAERITAVHIWWLARRLAGDVDPCAGRGYRTLCWRCREAARP